MPVFTRRENPPHFPNYLSYKPFLRKDFEYRCVYCERTETHLGGEEAFEVEHFKPKAKFPRLVCEYGNLYYACRRCNGHKWRTWPSPELIERGFRFADPCEEDLYAAHIQESDDGSLQPKTPCGSYSCQHIRLDREELRTFRQQRRQARLDMPTWIGMVRLLEQLRPNYVGTAQDDIDRQIQAVRKHIEDSERRFSLK